MSRFAREAAEHYQAVFNALVQLPLLFPLPQGGNPDVPANAAYSIDMLERAKSTEELGVEVLELLLAVLRGK
jgi:hypothetical protein